MDFCRQIVPILEVQKTTHIFCLLEVGQASHGVYFHLYYHQNAIRRTEKRLQIVVSFYFCALSPEKADPLLGPVAGSHTRSRRIDPKGSLYNTLDFLIQQKNI